MRGGAIFVSPFFQIALYFASPATRVQVPLILNPHFATIMMGCLLSLLVDMKIAQRWLAIALHPVAPALAILFLMAVDTPMQQRWKGIYSLTVGTPLVSIAVAIVILYCVFRHDSPLGKLLNLKAVRHIGQVSYSVYLWQQLFSGPYTHLFPANILAIFLCAEISFWLVEKPSLRARDFIQGRLFNTLPKKEAIATSDVA